MLHPCCNYGIAASQHRNPFRNTTDLTEVVDTRDLSSTPHTSRTPPSAPTPTSAPAEDTCHTSQNPCARCASRLLHQNAPRTTCWQQLKAYLCHKTHNHATSPHCYCPAAQPQPPTNASARTLSSTPHPLDTQRASLGRRPLSWTEWLNTDPERETGPTTRTTRARPTILFRDGSTPALPRGGGSLARQAAATGGPYCLVADDAVGGMRPAALSRPSETPTTDKSPC